MHPRHLIDYKYRYVQHKTLEFWIATILKSQSPLQHKIVSRQAAGTEIEGKDLSFSSLL